MNADNKEGQKMKELQKKGRKLVKFNSQIVEDKEAFINTLLKGMEYADVSLESYR